MEYNAIYWSTLVLQKIDLNVMHIVFNSKWVLTLWRIITFSLMWRQIIAYYYRYLNIKEEFAPFVPCCCEGGISPS